jgi:hypothetical protein
MGFAKSVISGLSNLFSGSATAKSVVKSAPSVIEAGSPNVIKTAVKSAPVSVSAVSGGRSVAKLTADAVSKGAGGSPSLFGKTIKSTVAGAGILALTAGGVSIGDYARGVFAKTDTQIQYEQAVKTAKDEADVLANLKTLYGDGASLMFDMGSSSANPLPILRSVNESQAGAVESQVSADSTAKWLVGGVVILAGLATGSYVYSKMKKRK